MSIVLVSIALVTGLAVILAILFLGNATINGRIADAIGLLGVALIGAAVALYVGHSTDENTAKIARNADENTRTVGINNILAQVETVTDTHQGMRPCSRYLVAANLMESFVYNKTPAEMPDNEDKVLCLSGFYARTTQDLKEPFLRAAQWTYLREQVLSFLNVVELAAAYSTYTRPLSEDEIRSFDDAELSGQKMLARYLYGMIVDESKKVMQLSMPHIRKLYNKGDMRLESFWRVCKTIKCD